MEIESAALFGAGEKRWRKDDQRPCAKRARNGSVRLARVSVDYYICVWESLDWLSFLILLCASSSALIYLLGAFQFGAPSPELSCTAQALEHLSLHCPIDVDAMST